MIDVTGVDLVKLVQQAYALSRPRGLGFLHYVPDVLSGGEAEALIASSSSSYCAVSLDYVKGRSLKLTVRRRGDRLELNDAWYDHTTEQLAALLDTLGIAAPTAAPHNVGCECGACGLKRRRENATKADAVREDGDAVTG